MTCRRTRKALLEYTLDDLEDTTRLDVESHLDGCPPCRQQAVALRRLWRAVPEPQPAALIPPDAFWERSWSRILERLDSREAEVPGAVPAPRRVVLARWAAVAAGLVLAFVLGLLWPSLREAALALAGADPEPVNHFAGLDSFQRASGDYLQRSRLLLLELQQTGAAGSSLDDPWLAEHSRALLGEASRHAPIARRIHNRHIERLLADLEGLLRRLLDTSSRGGVDPGLEAEMSLLLFRLEMMERPDLPAAAPAAL